MLALLKFLKELLLYYYSTKLKVESKIEAVSYKTAVVKNRLADSLSRLQVQSFKQLAPAHMDKLPTKIPHIGSHSFHASAIYFTTIIPSHLPEGMALILPFHPVNISRFSNAAYYFNTNILFFITYSDTCIKRTPY